MDAFVFPMIYHGGRLERLANAELGYLGGEVKNHEAIDVDFVNKEDMLLQVRDLGYTEFKRLLWHDPTHIHLEDGLHLLAGDTNINDMYSSSSSSSDDGYESTEDSPYMPPPPGFESDDSDGIAANEKLRKEKGKNVAAHKKKKFCGKRMKHHVLSGDGSGSSAGSGLGSGGGVGSERGWF
ncbi:hypothetical protein PIB30_045852 [Stylosanthes scabra]|uniref:PB1-like domain-containing protein n=1 Tax=Stylosanthes scabra TaxID=79078 RepID=A0ABU6WJ11_9FABA|nr:hypothetical protein [Stylosanthes scabra]